MAKSKTQSKESPPKKPRVFGISFATVYAAYVQKVERKGRGREELDDVIAWLTGYRDDALARVLDEEVDVETFFESAPQWNQNAELIKGVVCGVRVEEVVDPVMKKVRQLDKLVDELAKGKKMESILRGR